MSSHGTFPFFRTDNILGHKSALNKYKKTGIIPCIFLDYNIMKLEVNNMKKIWKDHKYMEVKEFHYKMNASTRKLKKKFKNAWKQMKM